MISAEYIERQIAVIAVQLADGKRLDLPRRGLHFGFAFPFADLLLVDVAYKRSDDVEVIALPQFVCRVFREAIPT